jgi:hypothetical protein
VLGTRATDGIRFRYPDDRPVEAALASVGIGIYLTGTGATARDRGRRVGEELFPSETVLLKTPAETDADTEHLADARVGDAATPPR